MPTSMLRGVNLVGGEYSWGKAASPKEGTDYLFVSDQDIDYLHSVGVRFARLVFSWELLQPALSAPLVTSPGSYGERLLSRVAYLRSKGIRVLLEPHGAESTKFARWKGALVGTPACPNEAFANLWSRLASQFKGDPEGVLFGLSNEPNNMPTLQWFRAAQAAILAIRATGSKNWIVCPGNGWSNAASWGYNWYDTSPQKVSNEKGWVGTVQDPLNRTMVGVHCYFNEDRSGGDDTMSAPFNGVTDLQKVVEWARAQGLKVHVGEFGASPKHPNFIQNISAFLNYIDANRDVVEGWCWWAYGPPSWWGKYRFTLCPSANYTIHSPAMEMIRTRLVPPPTGPAIFACDPAPHDIPADTASAFYFQVDSGMGRDVRAGRYRLTARTRAVSCGETGMVVFDVTLENPNSAVELGWSEVRLRSLGQATCLSPSCAMEERDGEFVVRPVGEWRIPARGRATFQVVVVHDGDPAFVVSGVEL